MPTPPYRFAWIVPILFLGSLLPLGAATDSADWRAGLARASITPKRPIPLAGYAARTEPFRKVEQEIYVKALALQDAQGKRALLLTCDLVGMSKTVTEEVCRKISEATGLQRDEILLNFSHTHTAPAVALSLAPSSRFSPSAVAEIVRYSRELTETMLKTARSALAQMKPATLSHATGVVNFPVNRREYTAAGVILGFNPRGPADRSVPVLRIGAPDGTLRGVVFGAACHNTCLTQRDNDVCGDYAGYAQENLEKNFRGVQAMFMQGCGGDTSPYPTGTLALAKAHGKHLADVVGLVLARKRIYAVRGPLKTQLRWLDLPLAPPPSSEEIDTMSTLGKAWQRQAAERLRREHDSGTSGPRHYTAPLALWQFGNDLTLVGLPGEPVADYVMLVERAIGPLKLWISGYCNDHFGYLPTRRILAEGGYEALRGLGHGRRFSPEVEETVVHAVAGLAADAGRSVGSP